MRSRYNERARLQERRLIFSVAELCRITAAAVDRSVNEIDTFLKVAEGGSFRIIEFIFRDGLKVIARIPFPSTKPAALGISSKVATIDFLRRHGIPVPKVCAWSSLAPNSVGAEYMIMEKVRGAELQNIWYSMEVEQRMNIVGKIVELEKSLFELQLPANGSIYYKDNPDIGMKTVDIVSDIAPNTFCVGPSTEYLWWCQRRDGLAVNHGPCKK
jgi:Phosphotransferase enzyme family